MLTEDERKDRNRRKAKRRKLAQRSQSPIVNLDAFRRLRFEATMRVCVRQFYDAVPTPELLKSIRQTVQRVIAEFARSKRLARSVSVLVKFAGDTLSISYWRDRTEIHVYDVYDAVNPGSKKLIGMHVATDGSRRPVMQGDRTTPTPTTETT